MRITAGRHHTLRTPSTELLISEAKLTKPPMTSREFTLTSNPTDPQQQFVAQANMPQGGSVPAIARF